MKRHLLLILALVNSVCGIALTSDLALTNNTSISLLLPSLAGRTLKRGDFPAGVNFYSAADCCGLGLRCKRVLADQSKLCRPRKWMTGQSNACQAAACYYCTKRNSQGYYINRGLHVCRKAPIRLNCFSAKSGKRCRTTVGRNGKIVIPAWRVPSRGQWRRAFSASAIEWKPNGGGGIDEPWNGNPVCMRFVPDISALYYFTVISSSPHVTEHNDAWFRMSSPPGFYRYQPRTGSVLPSSTAWFKGYQNEGDGKQANYILNVDYNGHQFVTPLLTKGNTYSICVAGRSTRYKIFKFVFVACPQKTADNWPKNLYRCSRFSRYIRNAVKSTPTSRCS